MNRRAFLKASFWSGVAIGVAPAFVRSESLMLLVPAREIVLPELRPIEPDAIIMYSNDLIWSEDWHMIASRDTIRPCSEADLDKFLEQHTRRI